MCCSGSCHVDPLLLSLSELKVDFILFFIFLLNFNWWCCVFSIGPILKLSHLKYFFFDFIIFRKIFFKWKTRIAPNFYLKHSNCEIIYESTPKKKNVHDQTPVDVTSYFFVDENSFQYTCGCVQEHFWTIIQLNESKTPTLSYAKLFLFFTHTIVILKMPKKSDWWRGEKIFRLVI